MLLSRTCLYLQTTLRVSDVGALGVVGAGGGRHVGAALFGVVKMVVVLVGAGGGRVRRAGGHGPSQQGEDGAQPPGVEGEAE